jgi:hypothetical protein
MNIVIYNKTTGEIIRRVSAPCGLVGMQAQEGEEFFLNCPADATHITNDTPETIVPASATPSRDELLAEIRRVRDTKLSLCDFTQIPDVPMAPEKRYAWAAYRQALRDLPATCDPNNPVWPVLPQ